MSAITELFTVSRVREATIAEMERPDSPLDDMSLFEIGRALADGHPFFEGATEIEICLSGSIYRFTKTMHEQGD